MKSRSQCRGLVELATRICRQVTPSCEACCCISAAIEFKSHYQIKSNNEDYSHVTARKTTRAANNMHHKKIKNAKKPGPREIFFSWRLKVLTESTRRNGDGRLFQTHGAATENERSPRGTWHCDRARRRGYEACSGGRCDRRRDEVGQITWCFAVQATTNSHAQLVLNTVLDRKPKMIAKQTSDVAPPGRAGDQTNGVLRTDCRR